MSNKCIVGTLALAAALSAGATTVDWGAHGPLETATNVVSPGSFSDFLLFTLSGNNLLNGSAVSTNLSPLLNITDSTISLYHHVAPDNDVLLDSYSFDGTTGSTTRLFHPVGPGSYFYKITGMATGSTGGLYSVASAPTSVPEPHPLVLALTALLTVGVISRRGKKR